VDEMSLEDVPNWIYTVLLAPMGFLLHKHISNSNRLTTLESNQKNNLAKLNKIDDLCEDISYIKGLLDEHLKRD